MRAAAKFGGAIAGLRRRLGVCEHYSFLGTIAGIASLMSFGSRVQRRGEHRECERPIKPLSEHGVGEPRRQRLALPSPAPQRRVRIRPAWNQRRVENQIDARWYTTGRAKLGELNHSGTS